MFIQFFGLKFNPFTKEVPVNQLYYSHEAKELESRLKYIQSTRGIFLLTAEPGIGKTTALRNFYENLNPGLYKPCYYSLTTVTVMDFYRGLVMKLGEIPEHKKISMFEQLQRLISCYYNEQRITPVIIVDEAQCLSNKILDDLRILFNFSMDSQNPFILILAGQTSLKNRLQMGTNTALRQRIHVKFHMQGLSKDELKEYIISRFKYAGALECDIFTDSAIESIHSASSGVPRSINNLITSSLIYSAGKQLKRIDEEIVYQASRDIDF